MGESISIPMGAARWWAKGSPQATSFSLKAFRFVMAADVALVVGLFCGCETPEGTAAVGQIYSANAALSSNPQQAAAWGLLGAMAGTTAQMQHEKEVAAAGRPQVSINVSEARITRSEVEAISNGGAQESSGLVERQTAAAGLGYLSISCADELSDVFVDGKCVGNAPARLQVAEGRHSVMVRRAGFRDFVRKVDVHDGDQLSLKAVLERE